MNREIAIYPNPVLRKPSTAVEVIDADLRRLAGDMCETLYANNGLGLAAPQVFVNTRLIVIDLSKERNEPQILVNPEITKKTGKETFDEGCLSFPGIQARVERALAISVYAQNLEGEELDIQAEGLVARAIQHEIDHLDGILFIDRIEEVERFQIPEELERLEKGIVNALQE
ncbi:MAG: peptide deformylase [Planctomycetota bacterium]